MKQILTRLVAHEELTREEMCRLLTDITQEKYAEAQIAALVMGIQMRGISVDELLGLRDGVLQTGVNVDLSDYDPIDIVGTGGDGKNTFNISTCSCIVVAGAGYKVSKHGNYAATSVSGASNVMERLGAKFTNDYDKIKRTIEECGFVYLHAPLFAKALKFVAPTRKALQIPTCFNLLGPIVNPARPTHQLLGVANLNQMRIYGNVYQKMGIKYGIVNSLDGYDEISLTGDFKSVTNTTEKLYSPSSLGLPKVNPEELHAGELDSAGDPKTIFLNVLEGKATEAQKSVVVANAAFAIHVIDQTKSTEECVQMARESIESGRALSTLKKYLELSAR